MLTKTNRALSSRLRVSYPEAQRVRSILLSSDVETLTRRDIQTLLTIVNDVYPMRKPGTPMLWQPLLFGAGIGLLVVLGIAVIL
jgi:hypothetical protein